MGVPSGRARYRMAEICGLASQSFQSELRLLLKRQYAGRRSSQANAPIETISTYLCDFL